MVTVPTVRLTAGQTVSGQHLWIVDAAERAHAVERVRDRIHDASAVRHRRVADICWERLTVALWRRPSLIDGP
ncbi:hypothetical protein [Streptomyces sp. NPDC001970]